MHKRQQGIHSVGLGRPRPGPGAEVIESPLVHEKKKWDTAGVIRGAIAGFLSKFQGHKMGNY
jgi:hypothetical protein